MRAIGFDPGTRHFGWGVVEREGTRLRHVAHGVVDLDETAALGVRLVALEAALVEVVAAHVPELAVVETIYFGKDAQATSKLGHARGVALLVACRAGLATAEYAAPLVKQAVAGSGRADKAQVGAMVRVLLGLPAVPRADAADALALALAHLKRSDFDHLPSSGRRGTSPLQAAIDKALAAAGPSNGGRRRPMR